MANVSTGINIDSNFMNLKAIDKKEVREEVDGLLINGEKIIYAFQTIRDQVIFTNNRVFVVNVKGITGKKIAYFSYPYSKIQYYGIETAGLLDIDSELILAFSNGEILQFDFKSNVDIKTISSMIAKYIL
ncbi:MAG: PH domain-containing protein [Bacilli bacterium]|nr:PH domain-containing protein [Bacilli bacterium]